MRQVVAVTGSLLLVSTTARAQVHADGRDAWTLLNRRLVNRQLFEQIRTPQQLHRLGRNLDAFAAAADVRIGTQQPVDKSPQSRFHGFYVLNTFGAVRPFYGVDANLNLTILNPSASDGYRVSSQVLAGVALHGYYDLDIGDREPVKLDVFGTDLGLVTLGRGLLLEQTPSEGEVASARFHGFEVRQAFIGRALWPNDDVISVALRGLDGKVELSFVRWQFKESPTTNAASIRASLPNGEVPASGGAVQSAFQSASHYVGGSVNLPFTETLRAAVEYQGKVGDGSLKSGVLARGDFLDRDVFGMSFHLGYQFRFYEAGFGPSRVLRAPTTRYAVPDFEDIYVTNPFEYFGVSEYFRQWSHTVMAEAIIPIFPMFKVVLNGEYFLRFAADRSSPGRVVYLQDWGLLPGKADNLYYKIGLQVEPWRGFPHRVSAILTNKQVASGSNVTDPQTRRFVDGNFYLLQFEAFL
jgi:hypothetical protein